jgi:hypothetical protein
MQRIVSLALVCVLAVASNVWSGPANRTLQSGAVQVPQPVHLSGFGSPLMAVAHNASDLQIFATGQINFKEIETVPEVRPIFNGVTCAGCHSQPAIGGGGLFINELRVRNNSAPGPVHIFAVDNMLRSGPQSQGGITIFAQGVSAEPIGCQITAPGCQPSACQKEEMARTTFQTSLPTCDPTSANFAKGGNCSVGRAATPLFGLGLVEAVADKTLIDLAQSEPSAVRGEVKEITELGSQRVARFGWKDDHATLRGFAADAYLNEMGITNPDNTHDLSECALDKSQFGVVLQTNDGVEDTTGTDGRADIDRFSDFMPASTRRRSLRKTRPRKTVCVCSGTPDAAAVMRRR